MTEPAYQQTPYPLMLSLSVALFLHVVMATLVNGWLSLPEPDQSEPTVRVRIAVQGAQPSVNANATTPDTTRTDTPPADATTPGDTEQRPEAPRAEPDPQPESNPQEQTHASPAATATNAESARNPGSDSPVAGSDAEASITRLSQNDVQQRSDYEIALWEKIAQQVGYTPLLTELDQPREVILNLRLMTNGALRRARVEASSGFEELDGMAREAALAATPFPEPPENQRRFSVRLIFEPATP